MAVQNSLRESLRPRGPVQIELSVERRDRFTLVRVAGEVDVLTVPRLAAELLKLVRQSHDDVVVDLDQTVFIDSAGIHVLLNAERRLTQQARRLTVVCAEGAVRQAIELARLGDALHLMSPDELEALA